MATKLGKQIRSHDVMVKPPKSAANAGGGGVKIHKMAKGTQRVAPRGKHKKG